MKKRLILLVVPLLLLSLLAAGVSAMPRQQSASSEFSGPINFVGKVQSLPVPTGSTLTTPTSSQPPIGMWKVQGLSVEVTADTRIEGSPQAGAIVRIQGTISTDGVVHARFIHVPKGHIEFTGFVQSMPARGYVGTWQIEGLTVQVNTDTKVQGTPSVGSFAKVEGTIATDGVVTAKEIKVRQGREKGDERGKDAHKHLSDDDHPSQRGKGDDRHHDGDVGDSDDG
ncbi:MAG: hypothetical protein FJ312_06285 [SAR202 cluster bacterium]|nr:hypothetical protein [SAR202 cluster bacterium]